MSVYALADCNNFYCSCERVFAPALRERPVVVLSNNDGCVIARSAEAKTLGIPMGAPAFQWERFFTRHEVAVFSSNYELYGDMSARVMRTLARFTPRIEIYSIDEAFLDLTSMPAAPENYAREICATVQRWTGIPVSIGLGATKTLAKVANRFAKKHPAARGVFDLATRSEREIDDWLERVDVSDVWGVGRRYTRMLARYGIRTARALKHVDRQWVKRKMTVAGLHTVLELRGLPCLDLEEVAPAKKAICSSRAFGTPIREREEMAEALASYTARAARKLRRQRSRARSVLVFMHTNTFNAGAPQYSNSRATHLPVATDHTPTLIKAAHHALGLIWRPGFAYKKCGVLLAGIEPEGQQQLSLLSEPGDERDARLMRTLDAVNARFGNQTLRYAAQGVGQPWRMQRRLKSPGYTTHWDDLPVVRTAGRVSR